MPSEPTYPGVYVEEVPGGFRPIAGVSTSVAAFVGRASRGPIESPVTVTSFGDFERTFGGLWRESALGFAVRDFFFNGGSTAVIVRLVHGEQAGEDTSVAAEKAQVTLDSLTLEAASVGEWGDQLRVRYDHQTQDPADSQLFNVTIRDGATGLIETHRDVAVSPEDHPRRLDRVLESESGLARVQRLSPERPSETGPAVLADRIWTDDATSKPFAGGSDGAALVREDYIGGTDFQAGKKGFYALEDADMVNLLVIPPYSAAGDIDIIDEVAAYAAQWRALFVVDAPSGWTSASAAAAGVANLPTSRNAAVYFPRLMQPNPLRNNELEAFAPSGAVAGVIARTDATRGVWKAPAGQEAVLNGVPQLSIPLTDGEIGQLNATGVNSLRLLPDGNPVVWGARTLEGADHLASEWKYLAVRRTAVYIEESLSRGTAWAVFEPNDERLWAQIRTSVGAFLNDLFRQGAFQGTTPREAYFVKCDNETTMQSDIDAGVVNIQVGFAPLKPAEFVIIRVQQKAGGTSAEARERKVAPSGVNARRADPYKKFKFRVELDGK
ncbi:phage tail sheath family protein [Microbacterium sp. P03]|uniref:phage tail sheath family protein n=1 Tax=Microbacterium sp. P03 TaxID=3366946 RepID=UPI00374625DA